MKIKNALAFSLVMAMGLTCFAGCSEGSDSSSKSENNSSAEELSSEESTVDVTTTHQNDEMHPTTANELVKQMKVGWNLGNTMDSSGTKSISDETAWGNPQTTKEMIDFVKQSGFNVLRVPVSWQDHISGDDYQIDSEWMNRVQEIVNYGIDNDMYVILNTHHEDWYIPKSENADAAKEELTAVWSQISERFKGYDEHLIFEGLNEPRLKGDLDEWTGTNDSRKIVSEYANTFVETVRNSGGNNKDRCLMITPYAASSMKENMSSLEIPQNDDKIIVSIHAYLPYSFALDTKGTDKFDESDMSIDNVFKDIDEVFLQKGIPVIIGEFGSVNKDQNTAERVKCVNKYLTTAKQYGVPCIWWDNGARFGDGENFGLLERDPVMPGWYYQDIIDEIMKIVNG